MLEVIADINPIIDITPSERVWFPGGKPGSMGVKEVMIAGEKGRPLTITNLQSNLPYVRAELEPDKMNPGQYKLKVSITEDAPTGLITNGKITFDTNYADKKTVEISVNGRVGGTPVSIASAMNQPGAGAPPDERPPASPSPQVVTAPTATPAKLAVIVPQIVRAPTATPAPPATPSPQVVTAPTATPAPQGTAGAESMQAECSSPFLIICPNNTKNRLPCIIGCGKSPEDAGEDSLKKGGDCAVLTSYEFFDRQVGSYPDPAERRAVLTRMRSDFYRHEGRTGKGAELEAGDPDRMCIACTWLSGERYGVTQPDVFSESGKTKAEAEEKLRSRLKQMGKNPSKLSICSACASKGRTE
jgi:hypothetical protein